MDKNFILKQFVKINLITSVIVSSVVINMDASSLIKAFGVVLIYSVTNIGTAVGFWKAKRKMKVS